MGPKPWTKTVASKIVFVTFADLAIELTHSLTKTLHFKFSQLKSSLIFSVRPKIYHLPIFLHYFLHESAPQEVKNGVVRLWMELKHLDCDHVFSKCGFKSPDVQNFEHKKNSQNLIQLISTRQKIASASTGNGAWRSQSHNMARKICTW